MLNEKNYVIKILKYINEMFRIENAKKKKNRETMKKVFASGINKGEIGNCVKMGTHLKIEIMKM